MPILLKRAYKKPDVDDGERILVERLLAQGFKEGERKG